MAAWLQASVLFLLGLLLAPTICSFVGSWLAYLLLVGTLCPSPSQGANGLQVILCGFPRTGTLSLCRALGILGFTCFHGFHLFSPRNVKIFMKAYKYGNPQDWKKLFEGFTAVADFPATCSYKDLAKVYPNAKIILNTRDANKWYNSFSKTIVRHTQGHGHKIFKIITTYVAYCSTKSLYSQFFNGKPDDRDICVKAFLQHTEDVKEHVPPENLLVYDIEKDEGWSSICHFLSVPLPDIPFPKTNATENWLSMLTKFAQLYTSVLAIYVVVVSCACMYMI